MPAPLMRPTGFPGSSLTLFVPGVASAPACLRPSDSITADSPLTAKPGLSGREGALRGQFGYRKLLYV